MDYWGNWSQLSNKMDHVVCCSSINDPSIGFISLPINYLVAKMEWEILGGIQKELPEKFDEVEGEDDVESEDLDEKRKVKQSTKFCLGTKKMKEEISENLLWYHLKQSKRERERDWRKLNLLCDWRKWEVVTK